MCAENGLNYGAVLSMVNIIVYQCHDDRYRREVFSIIISALWQHDIFINIIYRNIYCL